MHPRARLAVLAAAVVSTASLAACGDSKLKNIPAGTSEDSVLKLFAGGSPTNDSLPNVYRKESYFSNGVTYDVLYYDPKGRKERLDATIGVAAPDTAPYKELTPVVFQNRRLSGAGWTYWDSVATTIKVPQKKRD